MTSLNEIQKAFVELLNDYDKFDAHRSGKSVSGLPADLGQLDSGRLKVYAGDLAARRLRLSRSVFPLTLKVLAKSQKQVLRDFWSRRTSTSYNPIYELDVFPAFLAHYPSLMGVRSELPYLADLAAYEWMRRKVHISAEPLAAGRRFGGEIRLAVNSSLMLERFDYPVHTIAKRVAAGRWRKHSYEMDSHFLAVYQDPRDRCNLRLQELGALAFDFLQKIVGGDLPGDFLHQSSWLKSRSEGLSHEEAKAAVEDLLAGLTECGILLDCADKSLEAGCSS